MPFPEPKRFEKPCADGCGRRINERNAWPMDEKEATHICTACRYKRFRLMPTPIKG